jgi:hypothetical protein
LLLAVHSWWVGWKAKRTLKTGQYPLMVGVFYFLTPFKELIEV